MSLLSDRATNPLARFTWGIEPPNSRRRRSAWLAVCLPTAVYCLFEAIFFFRFNRGWSLNRLSPENLLSLVNISSMFAMACVLVVSILVRSFRGGAAHRLKSNWPDYRLAGLTGGQMVRGLSGPGIIGLFSAAALHFALHVVGMLFVGIDAYLEFDADFWATLVLVLAPAFALILFSLLDAALCVLTPATLARLIADIAITIAASPAAFLIGMIITSTAYSAYYAFVVGEVVSWPFRILIVRWLWLKAIRRLDSPLPASSDSGLRA